MKGALAHWLQRLQYPAAGLIQNGRPGLEICQTLGKGRAKSGIFPLKKGGGGSDTWFSSKTNKQTEGLKTLDFVIFFLIFGWWDPSQTYLLDFDAVKWETKRLKAN